MSVSGFGRRALSFVEDVNRITTRSALLTRLEEELTAFGFDSVTIGFVPGPHVSPHRAVLWNTRPADYVRGYLEMDQLTHDPVLMALRDTSLTYSWADAYRRPELVTARTGEVQSFGRAFDMRDGIVIPVRRGDGRTGFVSPTGYAPDTSAAAQAALSLVGMYGFDALMRYDEPSPEETVALTAREREVLTWAAAGKSDADIATILGISAHTVNSFMKNAKCKLNVHNRTHAVVRAMKLGEIHV